MLVVLALGAAIGGWQSTRGSTGSSAAAGRLERQSLAAALDAGSFHYVSTSTGGGPSQVTVGDAGATVGRQAITIGQSSFDVRVVGSTAFFRGDATSIEQNLAVPGSVASTHAGQWISLASGDAPYASVYAAVKTSDALNDNVTFTAQTVLATSDIGGQQVTGVRGPVSGSQAQGVRGTATLYVQASGRHLPVRYVEQGSVSGTGATGGGSANVDFRIDFSAWGEPVSVDTPSAAVAFSSLGVSGTGPTGSPPSTVLT